MKCNAETLPFPDASFDLVTIAFGLRNVTDKRGAARDAPRAQDRWPRAGAGVLAKCKADWFKPIYDFHSFNILPALGELFASDADSYQYLAESIRKHPPQEELQAMMEARRVRALRLPQPVRRHRRHPFRLQDLSQVAAVPSRRDPPIHVCVMALNRL